MGCGRTGCSVEGWNEIVNTLSTPCLYFLVLSSLFAFSPSEFYCSLLVIPFHQSAVFLTLIALFLVHNLAGSTTNKIFNLQSTDGTFHASETGNLVCLTSWSLAEGREEWEVQQVSVKASSGKCPLSALLESEGGWGTEKIIEKWDAVFSALVQSNNDVEKKKKENNSITGKCSKMKVKCIVRK